jgi:hypothetical protein
MAEMGYIVALVLLGLLVMVGLAMGLKAWRIWTGREEAEAGGSMGDQLLGRWNRPRAKRDRKRVR